MFRMIVSVQKYICSQAQHISVHNPRTKHIATCHQKMLIHFENQLCDASVANFLIG